MKHCLLFTFLLVLFNACSKPADVDLRDKYVGEYSVIFKAVGTTATGTPTTINQAGTMTVVKGLETNQISFVDGQKYLTANLSGSTFSLVPIVSPADKDYVTNGTGSFSTNSFTMKTIGKGGNNYPTEITMTGTKK